MNAFWIILAGSFVAISCGLLGSFLILRRMAMVGDAISHAVLPGIVIAFMIAGRDNVSLLIGAALIGIFTTFMIEYLHQKGRLQTDASIGVSFTFLFAIGVILLNLYAGSAHIDQDCVLHGEIAYVPIDLWITKAGTIMGPRVVYITGFMLLLNIAFISLSYKELYLTTFDPSYARAIGISASLWHYLLMGAVSMTTVTSFESVGAILVVALLIAPPATAYLLTRSFKHMLILTVILGVIISISGYYLAVIIDGSIAGAMSVVAGFFFALAFLFSPTEGVLFKKKRARVISHESGGK